MSTRARARGGKLKIEVDLEVVCDDERKSKGVDERKCRGGNLKVEDGLKVAGKEERKSNLERTPIIAVTAHTLQGDERRCIEAGMDDYISKPLSIGGLKAKIAHWIDVQGMDVDASRARGQS